MDDVEQMPLQLRRGHLGDEGGVVLWEIGFVGVAQPGGGQLGFLRHEAEVLRDRAL